MTETPDSTTGTTLHDALTDLAESMPASVALLDHVHDEIRRQHRRRRVARSTGAVVVAAAALGGLVVLRSPAHEVTVAPASVPSPPALPSCADVLALLPSTTLPAKPPATGESVDKAAIAAAGGGTGTPSALDQAKAAAAEAAATDGTATTTAGATKEPPAAKAVDSPPSAPGDHTKGLGVVAGTPTATSVSIIVTDGIDVGKTLTFTRGAATQYLAGDTPCAPEPLAAGQRVGYAATYNADGTLALDYLLMQ